MEQSDMVAVQPNRIAIRVREDIDLGMLQDVIGRLVERIGEINGCTACGLNGFDLDIGSIRDNPPIDKLRDFTRDVQREVPHLVDVSVFEGRAIH